MDAQQFPLKPFSLVAALQAAYYVLHVTEGGALGYYV